MTDKELIIANVIGAGGGRIAGRVRLQKTLYLLDQMGMGSGFSYAYHHYGPYSAELSEAVADATAFNLVHEFVDRRASDGVSFSIYESSHPHGGQSSRRLGELDMSEASIALERMQSCSSTVLELAATIHWLRTREDISDWQAELRRRKGVKASCERTQQAVELLGKLGL